ncbi:hypothetical protein BC829DRAFT_398967 [Chytridium lagenaria]|nr:hypothetical protein BC829DRAFT_398967 [Chytridium lagenaria]
MQTFMLSCILVWVIFGNYALLNLYVPASSPLNFLTPLFLYLTCFCNTLFAVYTRELRLRHIFLLERDIAQARMQTMGLVSSSSTDELYRTRMEKESLRGLPLPPDSVESLSPFKNMEEKPNRVQLPSLKPEPRKVGILGRVWGKLQKMGRLQDMKLENEFLAWQHDQILNEVIRAIVDGVT